MRIALDTNVLASALGSRGLCSEVFEVILAEHAPVVVEPVLSELRRVLGKKFKMPAEKIGERIDFLRGFLSAGGGPIIDVRLRDIDDERVMKAVLAANSDMFVTGDRDFLDVWERPPVAVVSPREFIEQFRP